MMDFIISESQFGIDVFGQWILNDFLSPYCNKYHIDTDIVVYMALL